MTSSKFYVLKYKETGSLYLVIRLEEGILQVDHTRWVNRTGFYTLDYETVTETDTELDEAILHEFY